MDLNVTYCKKKDRRVLVVVFVKKVKKQNNVNVLMFLINLKIRLFHYIQPQDIVDQEQQACKYISEIKLFLLYLKTTKRTMLLLHQPQDGDSAQKTVRDFLTREQN